jgi:cell fate regulator YaaT (PSP1 superfamily)
MPILPLPQFEADLEADRKVYDALKAPKTIVVRFGVMKLVGEYPYDGEAKPGCGSKLVIRSHRGTEIGEMLTSTCPNSGCSKSVTRQQMLEYIDNSGGRDYPFFTEGRILRVATLEDMERQSRLEQQRNDVRMEARRLAQELRLPIKIVEAELLLGGERLTFYFTSEERVDFRELVRQLGQHFSTRVEMRQVGARDEARLVADYERCGQYCCCKNFLKVLKPVSMRSAKIQKATLDPLKISGRCGRLMCCLRYEDQTYDDLRKRLPRRKQRVGTPEGPGIVLDTQILTQLALVQLEGSDRQVAVAVEDLSDPAETPASSSPQAAGAAAAPAAAQPPVDRAAPSESEPRGRRGRRRRRERQQPGPTDVAPEAPPPAEPAEPPAPASDAAPSGPESEDAASRRRRRRRRRRRGGGRDKTGGEPDGTP